MRICITRSERHSYSETFIHDQIAGLSLFAEVFTIHSGRLPERTEDGKRLSPWIFWILHKIIKTITGKRNNFFGNYGVKKFLINNKIDVVLANYGLSAAHMVPICRDLNIPLLVVFHGHDATDKKLLRQYANKYKALFAYASSVITVSHDMRASMMELGADPSKIQVVPCGVDVFKFKPSFSDKEDLFVAVGRFVAKKGQLLTIDAFHRVWQKYPAARLVLVGNKNGLYEECHRLVRALGIQDAVSFPGILRQGEISALMGKALAFVQHSVTAPNGDMEGTPVSILEACASGLPVISTFHGGIKDAVVHEKTGFLVDEGDVQGMADCMIRILEDLPMAVTMGREGRLHITAHYNQTRQLEKLNKLAIEAINGKNHA
jgi:colanic acid/amylovoran biosynthesis glycosyltransferase